MWPECQICMECAFGLAGQDDDEGLLSGIPDQPYAICCNSMKKMEGVRCDSFKEKISKEDA